MRLTVAAVVIVAATFTSALAERPTREQMEQSIAKSKESWSAKNAPPTQEEAIAEIKSKLEAARLKSYNAKTGSNTTSGRKAFVAAKEAEAALEKELDLIRKKYVPPAPPPPQLDGFDWKNTKRGSLGVISGQIIVVQIIGESRFIGRHHYHTKAARYSGTTFLGMFPEPKDGPEVVFAGVPTDGMNEGRFTTEWEKVPGVVVGQETFSTVLGGTKTLPVIEAFTPDKIAEWR